jgi:hypothetical protein
LYDAALTYHRLTGELPSTVAAFVYRFMVSEPEIFRGYHEIESFAWCAQTLSATSKKEFLEVFQAFEKRLPLPFAQETHEGIGKLVRDLVRKAAEANGFAEGRDGESCG